MRIFRFVLLLLPVLAGLFCLPGATAGVSYASDFATLNTEHERMLATLDAPIDRRYQAALTTLLARAQREKDVEMTATIQQALARLAGKSVPAAASVATVTGQTASVKAAPAATAAATPQAASTPAADLTTPVGRWRWHVGPANTLTEKGAVLQGMNVAGQWKWTSKDKGELQISWTGGRYRPPEIYTLSAHGNHLSTNDSVSGNTFTEDRIEQ